ncbi:DUF4166 domain-containing protein [Biomphalaria pfeifferi]|uniref:DUF4166 domain-containing protein n=1 Tax=Biomphalaria pfeifferi TaxID=112525 RepID=A0AAD8EU58_BIOPF|nr:DUF4166 domain-containing protein [Biomphalaria pfeifferi]
MRVFRLLYRIRFPIRLQLFNIFRTVPPVTSVSTASVSQSPAPATKVSSSCNSALSSSDKTTAKPPCAYSVFDSDALSFVKTVTRHRNCLKQKYERRFQRKTSESRKIFAGKRKRYLPNAKKSELNAFVERQFSARRRVWKLKKFYGENFCNLTRLHLLAACAISLGRFCGVSKVFDEIGESLMPIDDNFQPVSEDWKIYIESCQNKLPARSLRRALADRALQRHRTRPHENLEEKFYAESELHQNEPIWLLLKQHLEVTLGVRLMDKSAIAGLIPHETAIADSLSLTVKKTFDRLYSNLRDVM